MDKELLGDVNPNRLNIFFSRESAGGRPVPTRDVPTDFFNVTLTFRRDSTIFKPYDRFIEIEDGERNNTDVVWSDEQVNIPNSDFSNILDPVSMIKEGFPQNLSAHGTFRWKIWNFLCPGFRCRIRQSQLLERN